METLEGTVLPYDRMGWFFRPSTNMYEFWWMGSEPKLCLAAEIVPAMPNMIADEIKMAITLKGARATID